MVSEPSCLESVVVDMLDFYKGKRIFITGHTGFKGSWLTRMLLLAGAAVTGFSLDTPTTPNLFSLSDVKNRITSIYGDVRNLNFLKKTFYEASPDIALHLAAQPIVRDSYKNPHHTYETNVMGTVNFLECVRGSSTVKSVLNVTTDKVYENREWEWGYRENEPLNGYDPYSNSKSCSELITQSYKKSFFMNSDIRLSTARSGNVIGGGDFANDRIIPDCIRATIDNRDIILRNPHSIRPYQHVLEPLNAYLLIVENQYYDRKFEGCYNVGPNDEDCIATGELAALFCKTWGKNITWINQYDGGPHEASFLKLDCSKIKTTFNWKPRWNIEDAIQKTIEWTKIYLSEGDISKIMDKQIEEFYSHQEKRKL